MNKKGYIILNIVLAGFFGIAFCAVDLEQAKNDFQSSQALVRLNAIKALGQDGSEASIALLIGHFKSETAPYLRIQVIDAISGSGSQAAFMLISDAASNDPNSEVRKNAINALGYFGSGDEVVIAISSAVAADNSHDTKMFAINALRNKNNDNAVDALNKLAQGDDTVREPVFNALGTIDTDHAKEITKKYNNSNTNTGKKTKHKKVSQKQN